MTQDSNNERHYMADENKLFVRKSDDARVGYDLYLAEIDSIENYSEEDMNEEEIQEKAESENKKKEEQ